jgi:hypothetical protein
MKGIHYLSVDDTAFSAQLVAGTYLKRKISLVGEWNSIITITK